MIVKASKEDAEELTEIALASKAYWGYSQEQLESWREDLTVTPEMVENNEIKFIGTQKEIGAFYILNLDEPDDYCTLEFLFVRPDFIGRGFGRVLLKQAFLSAKANKKKYMRVLSDPNAESFYAKYGFKVIAQEKSSIPNRFLPIMEKDISEVEFNPVL